MKRIVFEYSPVSVVVHEYIDGGIHNKDTVTISNARKRRIELSREGYRMTKISNTIFSYAR
jgi:hypothetical protein